MKLRWVVPVALLFIMLFSAPALAASSLADKPFVVVTGQLEVPQGETASSAVIFNGDATIDGSVTGSVVAFNGDVIVSGSIDGDAVALNGSVVVNEGAEVHGNVTSRLPPQISGTVDGTVRRSGARMNVSGLRFASRVAIWIGSTVSSFLLGLVLVLFAPRAAEATAGAVATRIGRAVGWGLLLLVGIPIAAILALVTIVGIPFGVGVLLALALLYWLGWVAGAFALGRRLVSAPASRIGAFAAGWGILRVIALVPVVGGIAWLATTVIGLGALAIAARSAGRGIEQVPSPPGMPPPPPLPA